MSLLLNVPFSEKDKAKALGAKWNPKLKKWYAEGQYEKYKQWFQYADTNLIILDHLYIIIGEQICFKCRHKMYVVKGNSNIT